MLNFDIVIIGVGRSLVIANKAAKEGKKVALIEKNLLGGTCSNNGCVPSKLLIGYANVIRAINQSSKHYIKSEIKNIDIEKIFDDTNQHISKIDPQIEKSLHENITLFRGEAKFLSNKTIEVNQNKINAETIVIATGTRAKDTPQKEAWNTEDIFPFKDKIPKSIVVVGAGFIACELVNFFDAVGIKTKLLVRGDELLSKEDGDIKKVFKEEFQKVIDIEFETQPKDISYEDSEFKMQLVKKDGSKKEHRCDAILYAIGRVPNSDNIGLENTDIKTDDKGFIQRDKYMQTSVEGVYVMGDVAGENMLQHTASKEALHLSKLLFENYKEPLDLGLIPHAVYSHPEIASVGYTQEELEEKNIEYVAVTTDWSVSTKVKAMKVKYPLTKLIIEKDSYKILGCHIIGPEASTAIHQIIQLIHLNNDVRALKDMIYIHPALSEIFLKASVELLKKV